MKIDNLKVGQIIKNYKELCNILGVEAKSSTNTKGRKLHHKHFDQYFNYEKQGQKYIITEIYKDVENKINRGGNNKVFVDDFKKLMIYMLHKNRSECMLLSKGAIYKAMNLVNENYLLARNNIPKLSEIIELPQEAIYEFYDYNSTKLRDTVERNLRSCRKESLLIFETVTSVAIYETIFATNEFNKPIVDINGELISETNLVYREATKEERQRILEFENEVKKEHGWKDNQAIFLKGKWKQFKQEVENKLKQANTNIKFYYEAYRITWNNKQIDEQYEKYCSEILKDEVAKSINNSIIKSITRSNKVRHTKALNNKSIGIVRSNKINYQASNEYIPEQEQLTFTLINQEAKSLKDKFKVDVDYKKLNKINKSKNEVLKVEQLELEWNLDDLYEEIPF